MTSDDELDLIQEVYKKLMTLPFDVDDEIAFQVAFHMSDWMPDLARMTNVMSGNNDSEDKCYSDILDFCFHLPEHVAKAKEVFPLLLPKEGDVLQ